MVVTFSSISHLTSLKHNNYRLTLLNGHKSIVSSCNCSSERCISFSSCRSSSCRGCPSVIRNILIVTFMYIGGILYGVGCRINFT